MRESTVSQFEWKETLRSRFLISRVLVVLVFAALGAAQHVERLELKGQLVAEVEGQAIGKALVLLTGAVEPFSARTWADGKGRFKFPNLVPGTYNLSVMSPGGSVKRRTVEVTRSFADERGTVMATVRLPRADRSSSRKATVSARELSVSSRARKEYQRAEQRLKKRDHEAAIGHLEKAIALSPSFVEALNRLGTIYYQTEDYENAESFFRQALEQDPEAFAPLVNLAAALYSLRRLPEALRMNHRALLAQPDDALANSQLGLCYLALGQYEQARTFLLRTKTIDPGHFSLPQLALAEIYNRLGWKDAAARELEHFLAHHPDSPLAPNIRGQMERLRSAPSP